MLGVLLSTKDYASYPSTAVGAYASALGTALGALVGEPEASATPEQRAALLTHMPQAGIVGETCLYTILQAFRAAEMPTRTQHVFWAISHASFCYGGAWVSLSAILESAIQDLAQALSRRARAQTRG